MDKFANLTDIEIYVLKRAMIESAHVFHCLSLYSDDKEFVDCAQNLLNELCDEDIERRIGSNKILT